MVVYAYSRWPEVFQIRSTTTASVLERLQEVFARFGNPETLVSDNGTQFKSSEFEKFCEQRGIKHICTPPYHPASNERAERYVDTLKRKIKEMSGEGTAKQVMEKHLFAYRSSPNERCEGGESPAQLFLGRELRTELHLLKPSPPERVRREIQMEAQYNRHHRAKHREFGPTDLVFIKIYQHDGWRWVKGTVVKRHGDVTYEVSTVDGSIVYFHANQMRERATEDVEPCEDYKEIPMDHMQKLAYPDDTAAERTNITSPTLPSLVDDVTPAVEFQEDPVRPPTISPIPQRTPDQLVFRRSRRTTRLPDRLAPYEVPYAPRLQGGRGDVGAQR